MIALFPQYIARKAIILYFMMLIVVPLLFGFPMEWFGYVWGIIEVSLFFYYGRMFFLSSQVLSNKTFEKKIFWCALIIRIVYVLISYLFYSEMSNVPPFEFGAIDSKNYHDAASACVRLINNGVEWNNLNVYFGRDLSDLGYMYYMTLIYLLTDNSIIFLRLINAIISAYTVVLLYRISSKHFLPNIAKLVAVFCAFMPSLIFYCGLHLKEPVMVFLITMFIYSADGIILENRKWQEWIPMIAAGMMLFAFRTVLGAVAFLSFFTALLFSKGKNLGWGKRIIIIFAAIGIISVVITDDITHAVEDAWNDKDNSQKISMEWRAKRKGGNEFAKYAGAAVFAPLIFTIPFPTMVRTPDQENLRLINGGNYIKNIMSFFTVAAIISMLLSGEWRKHVFILSYILGYLIVITFSSFAQSERFHQPVLPFELMLAAYGVSLINTEKGNRLFNIWLLLMFFANIAWQWFKLAGRGMM